MDYEYSKLKLKLQTEDGKCFYERMKKIYVEKFGGKPIVALDYSKYKLIYKTGNRAEYEKGFFERRSRLTLLQLLALGDDFYIEPLEDIIAAICDEFTWLLSSHAYAGNEGRKDGFDYTRVDLFASEIGFYLSETVNMFGDKLSADIKERIKVCVKTKLLDNFESRTFWWEGDKGSNWTAVCAGGVGISYMYLFPERFVLVKDRIFALFNQYIRLAFTEDGVCVEGTHYYNYGVGWMLFFCDIYKQKFGDLPEFIKGDKIKKIFDYHLNSIVDGWAIPFADTSELYVESYDLFELTTKKLFPSYTIPDYNYIEKWQPSREVLTTRVLDSIGRFDIKGGEKSLTENFSRLYKSAQIFSCKKNGYILFAKGGNNKEIHNHNDVGCFVLYRGKKRIIADIGSGEYSWEYFEDIKARYGEEIFCCGSCSHSVPIIGGKFQEFGDNTQAKLLSYDENGIKLDIIDAYKLSGESMQIEYKCKENGVSVGYAYAGEKRSITFRFISDFKPRMEGEDMFLDDVKVCCNIPCKLSYKYREWKKYEGVSGVWTVDFIVIESEKVNAKFDFIMP